MKRWPHRIILAVLAPLVVWGAEPFRQNDRVAFVGDSITHGGSYHTLVQTFYATRFPERTVACFNVGISGDTAQGGYQRSAAEGGGIWESDVRMYKPTAATIMLGMNDVGGGHFQSLETREAIEAQNAKQLEWYAYNYATLLDHLETLGVDRITLIKSSAYDQTMVNEKARENLLKFGLGKNDALVDLGTMVIDAESASRGYPVIDFNTPMLEINARQQKADPAFSIIGNDRVHPGPDGHMVMAYVFLKSQGLEGPVAEVGIFPKRKKMRWSNRNCVVSSLRIKEDEVSFGYKAKSLPFPRSPYSNVSELIPFEQKFNREILTVADLKPGRYVLKIDGIDLGPFTHEQLAGGINMALLDQAPQVVQANEVLAICQERARLGSIIRQIVWSVGYLRRMEGFDADNVDECKAMIARIEAGDAPEGPWGVASNYIKGQLRTYAENVDQYSELVQKLDQMTAPLYKAAQPTLHNISITRIN